LGAGSFGVTFRVMDTTTKQPSVLKLIRWVPADGRTWSQHLADAQRECEIQTAFAKVGLTIPMLQPNCAPQQVTIAGHRFAVLQMDFITENLAQWLRARRTHAELTTMLQHVMLLINKMSQNNLTHGDTHLENIGVVNGAAGRPSRIVLIDFGQAHVGHAHPLLDFVNVFQGTLLELGEVLRPHALYNMSDEQWQRWWQSHVVDAQARIAAEGNRCLKDKVLRQTDDQCQDKIAEMYKIRNLNWMKQVLYKWFVQQWPNEGSLLPAITSIQFGTHLEEYQKKIWNQYMRTYVP